MAIVYTAAPTSRGVPAIKAMPTGGAATTSGWIGTAQVRLTAAIAAVTVAAASTFAAPVAHAAWPERPITLVVPFAVGGNTDVVARVVAAKLGTLAGQPIVVDNRTGAGAVVGTDIVAKSAPDGYTLLFGTSAYPISAALYTKLPYDPATALVAASLVAEVPMIFAVNPNKLPVQDAKSFVETLRANPGKYDYGSAGNGSAIHMAVELLKYQQKLDIVHVPYRGAGPAMQGLLAGDIAFLSDAVSTAAPLIRDGRLRGLAVTTQRRSKALPDVPTMQEAGFPDYQDSIWNMIYVPRGTPQPIIDRIAELIAQTVADPDVAERFAKMGVEPAADHSPAYAQRYLADEMKRRAEVVRAGGLKAD